MITDTLFSEKDGLALDIAISEPKCKPKAIIQFSHGMCEHKERYFEFMKFLSRNGYACVIHDHRGHGKSVKSQDDLGFFYTEDANFITDDLYSVTKYIKGLYKELPLYLFSHSMGTLVTRNYLKKYDSAASKVVLCGPPTYNPAVGFAIYLAKSLKLVYGERFKSRLLYNIADGMYNRGYDRPHSWINSDLNMVKEYESDKLCNYTFTINGYINLFNLLKNSYISDDWNVRNNDLKFLIIAGGEDPVTQDQKQLIHLKNFLNNLGYSNTALKIYPKLRHELLHEKRQGEVYGDVLSFFNGTDKN